MGTIDEYVEEIAKKYGLQDTTWLHAMLIDLWDDGFAEGHDGGYSDGYEDGYSERDCEDEEE
jgi:hypothetical protein